MLRKFVMSSSLRTTSLIAVFPKRELCQLPLRLPRSRRIRHLSKPQRAPLGDPDPRHLTEDLGSTAPLPDHCQPPELLGAELQAAAKGECDLPKGFSFARQRVCRQHQVQGLRQK